MLKNISICFFSLLFFLFYFAPPTYGQNNSTIFWMNGIPQSSYSNPALMPQADFYIGIPGISSHFSGVAHSGFAFDDLLRKNQFGNFYWDEDQMLSTLKRRNLLDGVVQQELLALGWRRRSNFFSFSASENIQGTFAYPRDFMTLLVKGNDHFLQNNSVADFSGIAFDFMHYRQFAFGFARQWQNVFSMGIRAKALFGLSNIWFDKADLSLLTHPDNYSLLVNANMLVNTSLPVSLAPLQSIDSDTDFDFNHRQYLTNTSNPGFALDVGMSWKPLRNLTLAASFLDIGFIDWRKGVENFSMNGQFEFRGVDLNEFFGDDEIMSLDNLLDSIKDIFDIEESVRSYRTPLNTKMFFGGAYDLAPRHKMGVLFRGEMHSGILYPSYTISYNYKPGSAVAFSLAYSIIHNNYHNVGAGMHLNLGPVQLYAAGDNFFGMISPHTMQSTNIQLGMNLVFGYRDKTRSAAPMYSW